MPEKAKVIRPAADITCDFQPLSITKGKTMKKFNKTDPTRIKTGDLMAIVHYVKVKSVIPHNYELYTEDVDLTGHGMRVQGKELLEHAFSADQYTEEVKVSKTQAAELLVHSPNRPFTVNFNKSDGTERTLRGRLIAPEPLLGRSMVEDLDETAAHKLRQVDHRTINWLVVEGTKYIVK